MIDILRHRCIYLFKRACFNVRHWYVIGKLGQSFNHLHSLVICQCLWHMLLIWRPAYFEVMLHQVYLRGPSTPCSSPWEVKAAPASNTTSLMEHLSLYTPSLSWTAVFVMDWNLWRSKRLLQFFKWAYKSCKMGNRRSWQRRISLWCCVKRWMEGGWRREQHSGLLATVGLDIIDNI